MRSIAIRISAVAVLCGLVLPGAALAAGGGDRKGGGKSSRKLSPAQLKKLREQITKRRGRKGGLSPKNASLASITTLYKEGEAAMKAENFASAYECFVDVAACKDVKGAASFAQKARSNLLKMEKDAAQKLEEAKLAKLQGKGAEALEAVKLLLEKYPYTKAAEGANDLLITLSNNPRVAAAVALVKAEELDKATEYAKAAKAYVAIMKKYPKSVQALKAKLRLKQMKEDEEISKVIAEAEKSAADTQCPKLMIMARNYAMNKMYPQARGLYQKVVKQYPDTEHAKEAKEALKEIKEKEAAAEEKTRK
jgi:tetratricopeptide (TPR) repeat protein